MDRSAGVRMSDQALVRRRLIMAAFLVGACAPDARRDGRSVASDEEARASSDAARGASVRAIRLVATSRIRGPREGVGFGRLELLALDAQASIFAFDAAEAVVHQFDSLGSFVASIGRRGAGPGEFGHLIGMVAGPHGLWTVDGSNARYTRFANGRVADEARRPSTTYRVPWFGGSGTDGHLYDAITDLGSGRDVLLKVDASGQTIDTVSLPQLRIDLPRRRRMEFPLPYSPEVLRAFDPAGASFLGRTDEYRLARITFGGDTSAVVSRIMERRPLPQQERDSIAKVVAALAAEMNVTVMASSIPQSFPLLAWCVVDDLGRLWVGLWDSRGTVKVDVVGRDGSLQPDVPLPFRLVPGTRPVIARGRFVGIAETSTGEHEIRVARIEEAPPGR
jgi:hypothetical protein